VSECVERVCETALIDVRRKASDWLKVARSRLKTPHKSTDDTLPPDDSAKKTRRKFVKYSFSFCIVTVMSA